MKRLDLSAGEGASPDRNARALLQLHSSADDPLGDAPEQVRGLELGAHRVGGPGGVFQMVRRQKTERQLGRPVEVGLCLPRGLARSLLGARERGEARADGENVAQPA